MRFWFMIGLLLWVSGAAWAQNAPPGCPGKLPSRLVIDEEAIVISNSWVNLRNVPGSRAERLDVIESGDRVRVVSGPYCGTRYAWWQVSYRSMMGWVAEGTETDYWLAPYIPASGTLDNVRVEVPIGLASMIQTGRIAADLRDDDPLNQNHPAGLRFTLDGYALDTDLLPSVEFYPLAAYRDVNPNAAETIDTLQNTAESRQNPPPDLPLLPALPVDTVVQARGAYTPFQTGTGIRRLAIFTPQSERVIVPTRDSEASVYYVFQGISEHYYVQALLPLDKIVLPPETTLNPNAENFSAAYETYVRTLENSLNDLPQNIFTPSVAVLDNAINRIETAPPDPEPLGETPQTFTYFDTLRFEYPAMLASDVQAQEEPASEPFPQYLRVDFVDYPIVNYQFAPQIRVYPVADFAANSIQAQQLQRLQQIIAAPQNASGSIPIVPITNAAQYFHAQVAPLEIANGSGVRFITAYPDGLVAIANDALLYSFQGFSDDGRFYISATFPLNTELLLNETAVADTSNYPAYLQQVKERLDQAPSGAFYPNLDPLDALLRSLRVDAP